MFARYFTALRVRVHTVGRYVKVSVGVDRVFEASVAISHVFEGCAREVARASRRTSKPQRLARLFFVCRCWALPQGAV